MDSIIEASIDSRPRIPLDRPAESEGNSTRARPLFALLMSMRIGAAARGAGASASASERCGEWTRDELDWSPTSRRVATQLTLIKYLCGPARLPLPSLPPPPRFRSRFRSVNQPLRPAIPLRAAGSPPRDSTRPDEGITGTGDSRFLRVLVLH